MYFHLLGLCRPAIFKGQSISKVFYGDLNSSKKNEPKITILSIFSFFICFFEEFRTPWIAFKIFWPLGPCRIKQFDKLFKRAHHCTGWFDEFWTNQIFRIALSSFKSACIVISNLSSISDLTLSNQSFGQTTSGKLHSFSSK